VGVLQFATRNTGRYPSGQRGQTVNLLRELRRFKSFPAHSVLWKANALRRRVSTRRLTFRGLTFGVHSAGYGAVRTVPVQTAPRPSHNPAR
jgi:hypothetical protein